MASKNNNREDKKLRPKKPKIDRKNPEHTKNLIDNNTGEKPSLMKKLKMLLSAALVAIIVFFVRSCGLGGAGFGTGLGIGTGGSVGQIGGLSIESTTGSVETGAEAESFESNTLESEMPETNVPETSSSLPEVRYVEITVDENGYLYNNTKQELEDILDDINEGDVIQLTIDGASKNSVERLIEEAHNRGIKVIEE